MFVRYFKKFLSFTFIKSRSVWLVLRQFYFYVRCLSIVDEKVSLLPMRKNAPNLKVRFKKGRGAKVTLRGVVTFETWLGDHSPISIELDPGAHLIVDGDLVVGPGTQIHLSRGAVLRVGVRKHESAAGFTKSVIIMAHKRIEIGYDVICAWNAFITDCDWHHLEDASVCIPTVIGDHVWVTPNCSILKGSVVGDNCIISTGSVLANSEFPNRSLIAGNPAVRIKTAKAWARDMRQNLGEL